MSNKNPAGSGPALLARTIGLLLAAASAATPLIAAGPVRAADAEPENSDLTEITVTATRRSEDIQKVPITITAYTQEQMDDLGIRDMDDIARLTPDVQFTHTSGVSGNNSSDISIRGVFSNVGAATTGIYINDTPIQMRNAGYWNANAFPQVFDLERVEVLRGPQGTLFGSSAEGGAIRFITPDPSLEKYSGYLRSDLGFTQDGAPSYELGAAAGGPLIDDKLGFRISVWGREDGGWIDRVSPDSGAEVDKNANAQRSDAGQAALTFAPVDHLKITGSLFYQDVDADDRSQYWSTLSDPSSGTYRTAARATSPSQDDFYLPAVKITYDTDSVSFFSNSSYFYHRDYAALDYTNYFGALFDGNPSTYAPGDQPSFAFLTNKQSGITQEFRVQSVATDALIDWTAGLYYSRLAQTNNNYTTDGQFSYTSVSGNLPSFTQFTESTDKEVAGYGNVDFNVTHALKVTAGVRVSRTSFVYDQVGNFSGFELTPTAGSASTTPVTPKFGLSYQIDPDNFVYATAAKGYRPGGVNGPVPGSLCTNEPVPESAAYSPDTLWSYELGGKNTLFGGRVQLDSSIYEIKWKNIQQNIEYTNCSFSFVGNLGSATGYGGDLMARLKITDDLLAGFSAGYTDISYDQTIIEGVGAIVAKQGDKIGGPPFNLAVYGRYKFDVLGHNAFYRIDYTYHNKTPGVDPATVSYDPTLPTIGSNAYLTMRAGFYLSGWELSAYGNNITNNESALAIAHDIPGAEPYYVSSYRPRTVGITAIYRY
jgi:outer membrane receptor protein involved in Fe transport